MPNIPTFRTYALSLVGRIEEGFSNTKHRQQWKNTLQSYCSPLWAKRIDEVDTAGVLACLVPIWQTRPENGITRARQDRTRLECRESGALEKR